MRRKKRILGVLMMVVALIIMQLPVSEADASSASDFKMEGNTLVRYRGTEKSVSVPDDVEVIGREAFEGNDYVELVVIPNSVKRIDPYAFWGCDNLEKVVLGTGLYEVGDYAFAGCYGLEQMTIPANIKAIGIQAFADCYNMTTIAIPAETLNIHETAFDCCYKLKIQATPGTVAYIYAQEFEEKMEELAEYEDVLGYDSENMPAVTPAPTQVPEESGEVVGSTIIVGNSAFFIANTDSWQVYDGYPGAEVETLPLADLMADNLENGIPKYAIVDGRVVADQAYYRSTALNRVALPEGIIEIGQFSFARSSVTSVSIPDSVIKIDYGAFYHCDYLDNVNIPDTVLNVEPKAFAYTGWVENFLNGTDSTLGDFLIDGGVLIAYRGVTKDVTIPDGVRVVAGEAFRNHTEIVSVVFPEGLKVIGEAAFEGCSNLTQIHLSETIESIKDRAFYGTALSKGKVTLPSSVAQIGLLAFGDAEVKHKGLEAPRLTYEESATRLSNAAYRSETNKGTEIGVKVTGLEAAAAVLEGADREYTLSVSLAQNTEKMEQACVRSFKSTLPDSMVVYDLLLMDSSGIPLTKLGNQALTVAIPIPESLKGMNLRLLILDRNGQPEALKVERAMVEGVECFCFVTDHLAQIGVYSSGQSSNEGELQELTVEFNKLSGGPVEEIKNIGVPVWMKAKFWLGAALFFTGGVVILSGGKRSKAYNC